MFFCDPFGHTDVDNLYNFGDDFIFEKNYIFLHDQEPVQITAHQQLFENVVKSNQDIVKILAEQFEGDLRNFRPPKGTVIVSEKGENVKQLCDIYDWNNQYYFFHGWACLDWFRGYHRTFLLPSPDQRPNTTHLFMSPNRIIGGERDHRVLFIYHAVKKQLDNNHISAPQICPHENVDIVALSAKYRAKYSDIELVLAETDLPWLYQGEETQAMSSCWLTNFHESLSSLVYVATETVYFGRRLHLTEKTFKPIAMGMPFMLVAPAGSLEYLREYGFRTFGDIWDESYDEETDDFVRLEKITDLLKDLNGMSQTERNQIQRHCLATVQHNWNHFYYGNFERVLWQELTAMLKNINV